MTIQEQLSEFFNKSKLPVLFAGAGASVRAGLPTWEQYLEVLAAEAGVYDTLTRQIMQARLQEEDLLSAAEYYFICKSIPDGQRFELLVEPLKHHDADKIECLAKLPFKAMVTTNFDRSLLGAYALATKAPAIEVNRCDPTLQTAPFLDEFYIARIHGRIEAPDTMVLSESQFSDALKDKAYESFLNHIFTRMQVVFIGFSFADPAILNVLKVIKKNIGPLHNGNHIAFVPKDTGANLSSHLAKYNIKVIEYDSINGHQELWDALTQYDTNSTKPGTAQEKVTTEPFAHAKKYLASTYARLQLGSRQQPLRNVVLEGIVVEKLQTCNKTGLSIGELAELLRQELHIPLTETREIAELAVERLKNDGLCVRHDQFENKYIWIKTEQPSVDSSLQILTDGVIDRHIVRTGGKESPEIQKCVSSAIKTLLLTRGWDLGAAFAAKQPPKTVDVESIINRTTDCMNCMDDVHKSRLAESLKDVLRSPNAEQAVILADLGRMSFALELILQTPHDTLFHALTLPERIYLDANVLMPAIVKGHPFYDVYTETISRLTEAAAAATIHVDVMVYRGFLNEVVSHRRIALEEIQYIESDIKNSLHRDMSLYDSTNVNVFIGAYANCLKENDDFTFAEFLSLHAPYDNEASLEHWLLQKNIKVIRDGEIITQGQSVAGILHTLEVGFSAFSEVERRISVTINHDAHQLAGILCDQKLGRRSIFVTADRKLERIISESDYRHLGNAMVSHLGLVQLIDLLVGVNSEARGLSAMLWPTTTSSEAEHIRRHLIDKALESYDEAEAMEMHQLVDTLTEDAQLEATKMGINWSPNTPQERQQVRKFLADFEERYFSGMREAIEKRRKETE